MADFVEQNQAVRSSSSVMVRRKTWWGKLGLYGVTLWVILTINFLLPRLMPGNPLLSLLDPDSDMGLANREMRARLAAYYGLDRSLPEQYVAYLGNLARGNLGWSITFNAPVSELIAKHLPWSLLLMIPAILLASLISLFAGAHAGWRRNSHTDRGFLAIFLLLNTIPAFLLGALLLMVFSAKLGWLPLAGGRTPFTTYPDLWSQARDYLAHLALPLATLTLGMAGRNFLLMRNSMINVLGEDFMLVARGKGLAVPAQKYRHGMRNALLPVITRLALQMGTAIGGAILIETLFAYPGMGRLMFNAVAARDYPVLEGSFLAAGLAVVAANLLADLSYAWIDPRTRRDE
jgi:peptide/nickel transport system permease protein